MTATGVGKCDLDQHGHPAVVKDVLYVPRVTKTLLSTYCMGKQGHHFVADAANPKFPPGLHFPRASGKANQFVALYQVQNLSYVATRNDLYDSNGHMLTRADNYVVWHRKLGFMPMSAIRKTKACVQGLEDLNDSHFLATIIPNLQPNWGNYIM